MPAGPGEEAERFAAAVELGRSPGSWGDDELARDLEIVAMLRSRSRAYDPSPAAKAQAKQKLMALLADPAADRRSRNGRVPDRPQQGRVLAPAFPTPDAGPPDAAVTELLPQVNGQATGTADSPHGESQPVGSRSVEPQSAEPGSAAETRLDPDLSRDIDGDPHDDPHAVDAQTGPGTDAESAGRSTGHGTPTRVARSTRSRRPGGRHSLPSRPAGRATGPRPLGASSRRFTLVGSAALLLALALAGAGILASRDALPGDGLYNVKRVAESAGLALTFDEVSRAHRHLDLATTRLGEVEQLVAADPRVSTEDPELVNSAIQQFDDSTGEGARILLADNDAGSDGARDDLRSWAAEQSTRLTDLKSALPAGPETEDALQLLQRVVGRTDALHGRAACATPPGAVDDLGPVPSCLPAGVDPTTLDPTADPSSGPTDPATAGLGDDPSSAGVPTSPNARGGAGSAVTPGSGTGTSPNTSRRAPADDNDPGLLDPVEDTLDGVLGGSSGDSPSSSSTAPKSSDDDDQKSSDKGGGGLLPPVEVPPLLPGLPGLSL